MEKKQKLKITDIWYYYKGYVAIVLVVVLAIGYTVFNKVTEVKDDFLIECISDIGFDYDAAYTLADSLEQSGAVPDINGDGNVQVNVATYQTGLSGNKNIDPQIAQVAQLRMAVGEGAIIIADKKVFEVYDRYEMFKDISSIADELGIDESKVVKSSDGKVVGIGITDSKWLAESGVKYDGLYAALRVMNADNADDESLAAQFAAAEDILKYIIK